MNRLEIQMYCAAEVLNSRRLRGQPLPDWLTDYYAELEATWEMSAHGPKSCETANGHPTLSAEEAAAKMTCTSRHARRLAQRDPRLGRIISGAWVFDRAAVEDYAARKAASA